jgi:hypothetical protein
MAMISLAATLARRRISYPRPIASLPDILMIDIPRRFASRRLSAKRFYPIMVETAEEQAQVDAFLARERETLVAPDLLHMRPSTFPKEHLTIAHYRPLEAGWPYVQLCQWPAEFAARASRGDQVFMRGAYTFELFRSRNRLEKATKVLLASLDRRHALHVETVFPDWSQDPDAPAN